MQQYHRSQDKKPTATAVLCQKVSFRQSDIIRLFWGHKKSRTILRVVRNLDLHGRASTFLTNSLLEQLDYESHALARQLQQLIRWSYQARLESWPDAKGLMEKLGESIRNRLVGERNTFDPLELAELLRIKTSYIKMQGLGPHGALIPVSGGFKAEICCRNPIRGALSQSEKFTLAHECGHTFFYYCDGGMPTRIIPRRLDGPLSITEEGLCDIFAQSLLQL